VRDLVRDDRRDGFLGAERGALRIGEEVLLAEGNRARVFHRAGGKVRHTDDVQLAELDLMPVHSL